jgi:tetratricopeptide (TPR) repeat protein
MVGSSVFPRAAHDLGDLATRRMPAFARAALLGSVVLAPLALGEGVLGLSIVLLAIGATYGGARNRMALALAATLLVLGLFPIARLAGRAIDALAADPVAESALAVRQGIPTRGDIELLEAVADQDLLAMRALAAHARQRGALDEALERYTALAEHVPGDPAVVTNLANLLFRAGEVDEAIALYQRATRSIDSPVLWFNLSQAYARTFQMEPFETALGRAQQLGDGIVAELSQVGDPAFVADLPLPIEPIRSRMLAASHGGAFAIALRTPVAPGRLGEDWMAAAALLALALVVATALGSRFELAGSCTRCGVRVCARCDGAVWDSQTCDNCRRLFHHPESTDPLLRAARLDQLRGRGARIERAARIGSILIPGLGGVLVGRPDLAFLCMLLFGGAAASLALRDGVVPDPLVLGATGPLLMTAMAAAAGLAYAVLVLASLAIRRNQ